MVLGKGRSTDDGPQLPARSTKLQALFSIVTGTKADYYINQSGR